MKFALSLLALVACAHAIPITKDIRTQTTQVDQTPTVIVGSSQVDSKSDGKVTLHLDQRSQISEPREQFQSWTVSSVPQTEPVKESLPQTVRVVEEPKQEPQPVLVARNDIAPTKTEETIRTQPAETVPIKTELGARNEVTPQISEPIRTPEAPVIRQVVEPQVVQQVVPAVEKPVLVVEQVAVPVGPVQPVVFVVPQVPVPVQIPVVEQDIPQTVVEPILVPEVPQPVAIVPVLEERATPVVQSSPVIESVVSPVKETAEPETKVVPKQGELNARNLKVDQAPVKAPIVVSSIHKQVPVVQVKTEVPKQVVPQVPTLEGKNAIVPEVKSEPQLIRSEVPVAVPKIVLEERKREEVKPLRVEPLALPEHAIRKEPVVIPVVQTTEIREPVQIPTVSEPVVKSEPRVPAPEIREPIEVRPVQVQPLVVRSDETIRKESVIVAEVPKETSIRATEIREIPKPVQVQPVQTVSVESIRQVPIVSTPVVATEIRTEPIVKVQSLPEEKTQ